MSLSLWSMMRCDVTQGVVVSDEELRRTFLQREEAEPQQGEEPVDGFRHPDLLGKTAPHTPFINLTSTPFTANTSNDIWLQFLHLN